VLSSLLSPPFPSKESADTWKTSFPESTPPYSTNFILLSETTSVTPSNSTSSFLAQRASGYSIELRWCLMVQAAKLSLEDQVLTWKSEFTLQYVGFNDNSSAWQVFVTHLQWLERLDIQSRFSYTSDLALCSTFPSVLCCAEPVCICGHEPTCRFLP